MKVSINGKIVEPSEAKISVFDRGYLFGEGLFETLRSYGGKLPFLDKHLGRMEWGATFVGVPFVHPREIQEHIEALLAANQLKDARIKIVLSAVGHSIRPTLITENMETNLVIACEKFVPISEDEYEEGVDLAIIREIRNDPPPASNVKSLSWLTKTVARREFSEKDCYDGILLSPEGYITECTSANVFWFQGETLCTAPISAGVLPGVTRDLVIQVAKDNGIKVQERLIKEEEFKKVSEIFITGSTLEVMPVTQLDSLPVGSGKPGKTTRDLRQLYKERIQEEIDEMNA